MPAREETPSADEDGDSRVTKSEIDAALEQYTKTVERRLKPDLDAACERRDKYFEELAKLDQITKALDTLDAAVEQRGGAGIDELGKNSVSAPIKTRVNIGEEFYVRAVIDDVEKVILDVGVGVMVEVTRKEARELISERKRLFSALSESATKRITHVQAHLKSVTASLSKLRAAGPAVAVAEENRHDSD